MALTRIRRDKTPDDGAARRRPGPSPAPRRDHEGDTLTLGAIYDIALHGAGTNATKLHGADNIRLPALTAATLDINAANAQDIRRLIQPWQARAMSYYDLVPEVKFAAQFMSQMLRKVRLFPAILDPDTHEPQELHDGPVYDAFHQIQDRNGGMEELQGSYGKLKFLIGECYLTVSPDVQRGEVWECLSPNELRVQPGGLASRFRAPMLSADQYIIGNDAATVKEHGGVLGPEFRDHGPDVIVVYRLWRPHPAYSFLADCSMQASIDILEELVLSTYSVRAQLKSRLNNGGLLLMPDEISFTSLGNNPEEDPNSDQFQERLTEAIMAAISDPGTAAAFSPIVVRMAGEFIKNVQHLKFNDNPGSLAEIEQRAEMVERFGVGAELPPDLFKSMEDTSHWNAWLVDEDTWDSYGLSAALEMASDICAAYLQPAIQEAGEADWQDVRIGVDPAAAISHPGRAKDADALYAGRAISKRVWRQSKGYNDDDAMPEEELNEAIGIAIRDGSYVKYGIPQVRGGAIEPAAGEIENPSGSTTDPVVGPGDGVAATPGPPAAGPPGEQDEPSQPGLQASAATDGREQRILGAADFAIHRARELAGSRLRAMTSPRGPRDARCEECQRLIDGVPNWDVAAVLGPDQVRTVANGQEPGLVDGAGQAFAAVLERMGVTGGWATELGELVEQHAARTLFDGQPEPLPAGFAALLRRIDIPLERAT